MTMIQPSPRQTSLIDAVRLALGDAAVTTDPGDIAPWLDDWRGRYHGRSPAILSPDSTAAAARRRRPTVRR